MVLTHFLNRGVKIQESLKTEETVNMEVGQKGPECALVGRAGALMSSLAGKFTKELGCMQILFRNG